MALRSPILLSRYLIVPTASAGLLLSFQRPTFTNTYFRQPIRCDSPSQAFSGSTRVQSRNRGGLNADVVRQVSTGSILGLVCGAAVAYLSKPLAIILGIFIAGAQYLEYKGVHIIPYNSFQQYFKNIDLRSAVQTNPAMKLSFGVMFALAGFGSI